MKKKPVFYPKNDPHCPKEAQKGFQVVVGKSQWKTSSLCLKGWKGSEVDHLEASLLSVPTDTSAIYKRQSSLANVVYLSICGEAVSCSIRFFHLKPVNGQASVASTKGASSPLSIPDLRMKSGRRNSPHHNVQWPQPDALISLLLLNNQFPWGNINKRFGDNVLLCPQRATLKTSEGILHFYSPGGFFLTMQALWSVWTRNHFTLLNNAFFPNYFYRTSRIWKPPEAFNMAACFPLITNSAVIMLVWSLWSFVLLKLFPSVFCCSRHWLWHFTPRLEIRKALFFQPLACKLFFCQP